MEDPFDVADDVEKKEEVNESSTGTKRKLEDVWDKEAIEKRIHECETELLGASGSKKRRIFSRLGELKAALRGEKTIGGNYGPKKKTIKKNKYLERQKEIEQRKQEETEFIKKQNETNKEPIPIQPKLLCYNCGSREHSLKACTQPKPANGTMPFATCYICKKMGHISANCPDNLTGIYPKGGGCHTCGSVMHLQKDCKVFLAQEEEKKKERQVRMRDDIDNEMMGNARY